MKRILIGLLAGMVFGTSVQGQKFTQAPKDVPNLMGADLFIDLAQYASKQVVITDAEVYGASNHGALLAAGTVTFKITTEGIDRKTFRYFLKYCNGGGEKCKVRLLATPTGKTTVHWPELAGVKIVR